MADEIEHISPAALADLSKQKQVRLIDVRTPGEFERLHASGATNIPLGQLDPAAVIDGSEEPIYVICRAGSRGQKACQQLLIAKPTIHAINVDGGTLAWEEAGLPVVRGRKRRTPEQRVRLAAGVAVLISILLSIFVHRGLLGIAGLVGAGLVLAGMTDIAGMGMALGRMPWNRRGGLADIGADRDDDESD